MVHIVESNLGCVVDCIVWRVAVDGSEVDDKLCRNVTGVVFRHPNLNLCCGTVLCGVLRWMEVRLMISCVETQQVLCYAIQLRM
jgi:hypothetical protein